MPAPPALTSKARILVALVLAIGSATMFVAAFSGLTGDDGEVGEPSPDTSTEPTVLGEVVDGTSTTLPDAPPASPVSFTIADDGPTSTSGPSSGGTAPPTTAVPPDTSPTIGPPVSITAPPRSTTTTASTTTTEPTTSTTSTTTTD